MKRLPQGTQSLAPSLITQGLLVHAKARRREVGVVVDHPPESILHQRGSKVDEKSKREVHQPQIGQELLGIQGMHMLNRFQFHNQLFINK